MKTDLCTSWRKENHSVYPGIISFTPVQVDVHEKREGNGTMTMTPSRGKTEGLQRSVSAGNLVCHRMATSPSGRLFFQDARPLSSCRAAIRSPFRCRKRQSRRERWQPAEQPTAACSSDYLPLTPRAPCLEMTNKQMNVRAPTCRLSVRFNYETDEWLIAPLAWWMRKKHNNINQLLI